MFRITVLAALLTLAATFAGAATAAPSTSVVVSELRFRGPSGGNDEFVELYNKSAATVAIGGWTLRGSNSAGTTSVRATIPAGATLRGGCYYLLANGGTSGYSGAVAPEATYTTGVTDDGGVALLDGAQVVDAVGLSAGSAYKEGTPLASLGSTNANRSYERKPGGVAGAGTDTDDNRADFQLAQPSSPQSSASACVASGLTTDPSGVGSATPRTVPAGGSTLLAVEVTPGANPTSTGLSATADLSSIGGPAAQPLYDDGTHGDRSAGDGTFGFRADVAPDAAIGSKHVPVTLADAQGRSGSTSIALTVMSACGAAFTPTPQIQGAGTATPLAGQDVVTEGVVVGDYEGPSRSLNGFYVQDPQGDGDPTTSDGVFVYEGSDDLVSVGDRVRVVGTAQEHFGQTELDASGVAVCGTGATVAPVDVTLPLPAGVGGLQYLERFEGMLTRFPQTLTVTEHFQLGRFGQVVMSAGDRLRVPTSLVRPGAAAALLETLNDRNRIIVDDGDNTQNADPILFGRLGSPLTAANTLRGGDTATGIVGVIGYTWAGAAASGEAYRLRPVGALGGGVPAFQPTNPRPAGPPAVGGNVKVVGMNLLNFFNTFSGCTNGVGGAAADCRGADSASELARQWPKTVAAITRLNPDVAGVMELENDGYGPDSALRFLVDRLNDATSPGTFAFVDVDARTGQTNALGTDAIRVALIYRPARVQPVGEPAVLNGVDFVNGGDAAPRNRPSLAQAFRLANGETFVVDVNHLKSKGSACDQPDSGDGQANCAAVRTRAAQLLTQWLATDPTGVSDPDVLIVGDLNAYAKEDPIAALEDGGYTNLIAAELGPSAYSYVFDGEWGYLDHALGTASLAAQVSGVGEWHVNADEPSVLDYTTSFKSAAQRTSLYAPDEFRISDHDPVVVGLDADTTARSTCAAVEAYVTRNDGLANSLCTKLRHGQVKAFANEVRAQSGKALTRLRPRSCSRRPRGSADFLTKRGPARRTPRKGGVS